MWNKLKNINPFFWYFLALLILAIWLISCDSTWNSSVAVKQDVVKPATCILEIDVNGYITKGVYAEIVYNYEINCYVLQIHQESCGESVPLIGTNLNITIIPK